MLVGNRVIAACLLGCVWLLGASGCDQTQTERTPVDFSQTRQVERPDTTTERRHLRVAVGAMVSPRETFAQYGELLTYLGRRLDAEIALVQRKTYAEVNALLARGEIDLAFVCSGPFAAMAESYGLSVVAVPVVGGSTFYRAYLIVPAQSEATNLADLRGKTFAFTDPDSNTGRLVPLKWLRDMGETPEGFFKESIYTYSHDNSILAVSRGLVDGASVDGLIWDYYSRTSPELTGRTRIVAVSEPYGIPPVVAAAVMQPDVLTNLRDTLLHMHEDPEGRSILSGLMIERFTEADAAWRASMNEMRRTLLPPVTGEGTQGRADAAAKP